MIRSLALFALHLAPSNGHGVVVDPPSNRHGGSYYAAGDCVNLGCMWFSQPMKIPGEATLPKYARSFNVDVEGGPGDWTRKMPWRAPGTAPVLGSGCGVAGGANVALFNGGFPPPGIPAGTDGITLPAQRPAIWKRGSEVEVAWAITANHGGGYSYRLCKVEPGKPVTEECFHKHPLSFVGDKHIFQYGSRFNPKLGRFEVPMTKVNVGTYPPGSDWARVPIPACRYCDEGVFCGAEVPINYTAESGDIPWGGKFYGGDAWIARVDCASNCAGSTVDPVPPPPTCINGTYGLSDGQLCPAGVTQFPEVVPGISGFLTNHTYPERSIIAFSIVDKVKIPDDLEEGQYLLGWRWDCEQTYQIWQNCADITIQGSVPQPAPVGPDWRMFFIVATAVLGTFSVIAIGVACFQCQQRQKETGDIRAPLRRSSVQ